MSVTRVTRESKINTLLRVSALERKIVRLVGGGREYRRPRVSTTIATAKLSNDGTISLLNTHPNRAFDFQAAPEGNPNENCESSASNHVDSEPEGADTAFKEPYFGRRYRYHEQRVGYQDLKCEVSGNTGFQSQPIFHGIFSTV